jgi:hypothetical protein
MRALALRSRPVHWTAFSFDVEDVSGGDRLIRPLVAHARSTREDGYTEAGKSRSEGLLVAPTVLSESGCERILVAGTQ